jgi:hypothetical protein
MLRDDLCVIVAAMGIAAPTAPTISQAGGQTWNSLTGAGANAVYFRVFWCSFNGTWSANPSVVFANESGTVACSVIMHVFRPDVAGNGLWAIDTAYAGASEASASPVVVTGITPANDDNVTLAGWLIQTATAITWGSLSGAGWAVTGTAQYRNTSGTDISASFAHQLQGTKAATGDVSKVPSTQAAGISFTVAWRHYPAKIAAVSDDQSTNLSDSPGGLFKYKASASEDTGAVIADALSYSRPATVFTVYDTVNWKAPVPASISETVPLDDSGLSARLTKLPQISEDVSLALSDTLAYSKPNTVAPSYDSVSWKVYAAAQPVDSFAADDSGMSARLVYLPQCSDTSAGTDSVSALFKFYATATESSTTTDNLAACQALLNSLTPESFATADNTSAVLRDLAALTDNYDSILADVVIHSLVNIGQATPINAAFSGDLGTNLSDSLISLQALLAASTDTLTLTDLVDALTRYLVTATDTADIAVDTLDALQRGLAILDESLSLADLVSASLPTGALQPILVALSDALSATDDVLAGEALRAAIQEVLTTLDGITADFHSAIPAISLDHRKPFYPFPNVILPETGVRRIRASSRIVPQRKIDEQS